MIQPQRPVPMWRRGSWINVVIKLIRFIPNKLFKSAEIIANDDTTKITGMRAENDLLTAGGTFSPRLICNFFTLEIRTKNSVASKATITPANIELVPRLVNGIAPVTLTAFLAPSGIMSTVLGIITIRDAIDNIAAARGFS